MTQQPLPHDTYLAAVETALADYGITVTAANTTTQDGHLLEGWIEFEWAAVNTDQWPHGVILGWDQQQGWQLIEMGGGRNLHPLDPEGVNTYSSPRQVACSTANALRGHLTTGPICQEPWDSRPLEAAIEAWEADQ